MRRASTEPTPGPLRPACEAALPVPCDLRASRFSVGGDEYAVLEFRVAAAIPAGLTAAEREVAALAAAGLSNGDIARRRGRAPRTVANQLASVFRKLGVASRAELAARCASGR
jgi:DNA-binding CsgD family transcriptional regulator